MLSYILLVGFGVLLCAAGVARAFKEAWHRSNYYSQVMNARLRIVDPETRTETIHRLDSCSVLVGRSWSKCDLLLPARTGVSRLHALIAREADHHFYISPMLRGREFSLVAVNGEPILNAPPTRLRDGDRICLGSVYIYFEEVDA